MYWSGIVVKLVLVVDVEPKLVDCCELVEELAANEELLEEEEELNRADELEELEEPEDDGVGLVLLPVPAGEITK